jgi:Cu-Zn family superoxide dismutase
VAIAPDGAAYFTDSNVPNLYRIKPDAQGVYRFEFWRDLRGTAIQYAQGFNLNGIVVTPDGRYLITVQSNTGKLFRIATDTKEVTEITLAGGDRMTAGDGLLLDGQTLYVVRNSLNLIVMLRMAPDFASGQQIGSFTDPSFAFTTTIAKSGDRLLVVNSQFNRRSTNNPVLPFTISSVAIP